MAHFHKHLPVRWSFGRGESDVHRCQRVALEESLQKCEKQRQERKGDANAGMWWGDQRYVDQVVPAQFTTSKNLDTFNYRYQVYAQRPTQCPVNGLSEATDQLPPLRYHVKRMAVDKQPQFGPLASCHGHGEQKGLPRLPIGQTGVVMSPGACAAYSSRTESDASSTFGGSSNLSPRSQGGDCCCGNDLNVSNNNNSIKKKIGKRSNDRSQLGRKSRNSKDLDEKMNDAHDISCALMNYLITDPGECQAARNLHSARKCETKHHLARSYLTDKKTQEARSVFCTMLNYLVVNPGECYAAPSSYSAGRRVRGERNEGYYTCIFDKDCNCNNENNNDNDDEKYDDADEEEKEQNVKDEKKEDHEDDNDDGCHVDCSRSNHNENDNNNNNNNCTMNHSDSNNNSNNNKKDTEEEDAVYGCCGGANNGKNGGGGRIALEGYPVGNWSLSRCGELSSFLCRPVNRERGASFPQGRTLTGTRMAKGLDDDQRDVICYRIYRCDSNNSQENKHLDDVDPLVVCHLTSKVGKPKPGYGTYKIIGSRQYREPPQPNLLDNMKLPEHLHKYREYKRLCPDPKRGRYDKGNSRYELVLPSNKSGTLIPGGLDPFRYSRDRRDRNMTNYPIDSEPTFSGPETSWKLPTGYYQG